MYGMAQSTKPRYVLGMVVLRHMVLGLLALALVMGPGWQSCATAHESLEPQSAAPANQAGLHRGHERHQHAMAANDAPGDHGLAKAAKGQPHGGHACIKCCGACTLTSVLPIWPGWAAAQAITRVTFALLIEQSCGRVVVVDPDIPKSIV